ncbi:transposase [Granulicella sp. dw_53]|uniref:REP-associated tyrosine transposase n=1 Tax=Granulicella sp. dw_53 TaxID=2719792 RepID=UPI001BD4F8F8|nr:transposase [Granulicella sp. dw_53]
MSTGLNRYQQTGDLHFITFSCTRKRNILGTPESRDIFLTLLEETRLKHNFHVLGYVVMPNHVHLLLTEPEKVKLSTAIQVLKQRFSRTRTEDDVWEPRYYDFNVHTERKRVEKLRYIHRNPVTRNLVADPRHWQWSSFRAYAQNERGPVHVTLP